MMKAALRGKRTVLLSKYPRVSMRTTESKHAGVGKDVDGQSTTPQRRTWKEN